MEEWYRCRSREDNLEESVEGVQTVLRYIRPSGESCREAIGVEETPVNSYSVSNQYSWTYTQVVIQKHLPVTIQGYTTIVE